MVKRSFFDFLRYRRPKKGYIALANRFKSAFAFELVVFLFFLDNFFFLDSPY